MGTSVRIIVWWLEENGRGVALMGAFFAAFVAGVTWLTMRMDSPVVLSENLEGTIMSVTTVPGDPQDGLIARYRYVIKMADGTHGTAAGNLSRPYRMRDRVTVERTVARNGFTSYRIVTSGKETR